MKIFIRATLFFLLLSFGLHAQTVSVSTVGGVVTDSTGAAVQGAQVKLTQIDTGFVRQVMTDETGSYIAPNLPVGPYRVEVSASGFSTYVQSGVVLQVSSNPKINVTLQVGAVSQQVEVQANAAMVETQSTGVGQVIDNQRVLDLPLNGRQVSDLMLLSAGTAASTSGGYSSNRGYPVVPIDVAGGGPGSATYILDGGTYNDPGTNTNIPVPFPDALREFKVETSALPAQYGQHTAAAVNMVTKSGTNQFHGDAFEFIRNGIFNAKNAFAITKDPLKRNQFGGVIGGPIKKDKLFFFAGSQGTITRTVPAPTTDVVPTAAMMAGDFSAATSAACNAGKAIILSTPAGTSIKIGANNFVNPNQFDPTALGYMKYIPLSTNPCGTYLLTYPTPISEVQALGRIDYQRSERHTIYGRYFWTRYKLPYFFDGKNALTTPSVGITDADKTLLLGDTYTINNNVINSFHGTLIRSTNSRQPAPFVSPTDLGAAVYSTPLAGHFTNLSVSNGFGLGGGGNNNAKYNYTTFQFADDVDVIHGKHEISFGLDYIHQIMEAFNTQYSNAQFTFNGSESGYNLADFLLGRVNTLQQGGDALFRERADYIAPYLQDSWKVTPRLTVNAGLRWEPYFPLRNINNHVFQFNPAAFASGVHSTVYVNAPAGLSFPGDAGYPGSAMSRGHLANLAPRVGVVWDPRGKGRESIRAAYGVFYDTTAMFYHVRVASVPPWGSLVTLNHVSLTTPYTAASGFPNGNPFPIALNANTVFPAGGTYWFEPLNPKPTYVQQWNLTFQKQLREDWLVTLSYFGNESTHLWAGAETDPSPVVAGTTKALPRLLTAENATQGAFFGPVAETNEGGTANYNAMLVGVQKRFSHDVSILENYTWSRCINDVDANQYLDFQYSRPATIAGDASTANIRADRGPCVVNHTNVSNTTAVLSMPKFNDRLVQAIAGDWQLSPILQMSSGQPLNVTTGADIALNGVGGSGTGQRPSLIGDPTLSTRSVLSGGLWFNTAAFAKPAPGTYGNVGRDSLLGPWFATVNIALVRSFPVMENKLTFQIRGEAFNLFNRVNPGLSQGVNGFTLAGEPTTALNSTLFGKITSAGDPRIVQLAAKITF